METIRRRLVLFLFLLILNLLPGLLLAQRVGHPAPAVKVEKYLKGPGGKPPDWEELRGQAIVLEFFATWCGPCVRAIPHMNRLVDLFADQPIRFISVTREKEGTVRSFLKRKPMRGWVAIDKDRSVLRDYGVRGYPMVVLIDSAGVLQAVTHPNRLNADVLSHLIMGQFGDGLDDEAVQLRESIAEGVRRSEATEAFVSEGDDGSVQMVGLTTLEAVKAVFGVDEKRTIPRIELGDERFDVARPAGDRAIVVPTLRRALEDAAQFQAEWREQERWVYVLKATEGLKKKLTKAKGKERRFRGWDGNHLSAGSLAELARFLEERMDLPVVDETGIDGDFELTLDWDPSSQLPAEALASQLGLEMVEEKRNILMLALEEW